MTSTTEDSLALAASHERDLAAAAPSAPEAAPIPPALWMLTVLIAAFFLLVGVCFWMGTQIR